MPWQVFPAVAVLVLSFNGIALFVPMVHKLVSGKVSFIIINLLILVLSYFE